MLQLIILLGLVCGEKLLSQISFINNVTQASGYIEFKGMLHNRKCAIEDINCKESVVFTRIAYKTYPQEIEHIRHNAIMLCKGHLPEEYDVMHHDGTTSCSPSHYYHLQDLSAVNFKIPIKIPPTRYVRLKVLVIKIKVFAPNEARFGNYNTIYEAKVEYKPIRLIRNQPEVDFTKILKFSSNSKSNILKLESSQKINLSNKKISRSIPSLKSLSKPVNHEKKKYIAVDNLPISKKSFA